MALERGKRLTPDERIQIDINTELETGEYYEIENLVIDIAEYQNPVDVFNRIWDGWKENGMEPIWMKMTYIAYIPNPKGFDHYRYRIDMQFKKVGSPISVWVLIAIVVAVIAVIVYYPLVYRLIFHEAPPPGGPPGLPELADIAKAIAIIAIVAGVIYVMKALRK